MRAAGGDRNYAIVTAAATSDDENCLGLNATAEGGATPLHMAYIAELAQALLDAGKDIETGQQVGVS